MSGEGFPYRLRGGLCVALVSLLLSLSVATAGTAGESTESQNALRTSWDAGEPALSPDHVASADFGELFETQLPVVTGNSESGPQHQLVQGQPLLADGYLVVATEENYVYGLDPVTGAIRWSRNLGPSWPVATINCQDIWPDIGVTSTPVYDAATKTLYVLDKTYDGKQSDVKEPFFQLHALDIVNGRDRAGWPVTIGGSATNSPHVTFNPLRQLQRPGLLLLGGEVYAGFAAHCNSEGYGPYGDIVGYVAGVSVAHARLTTMWSTNAGYESAGAGIWQGGGGLVSDGPGSIFVATGNGLIAAPDGPGKHPVGTLANSVVHLQVEPNGSLKAVDFFSPTDSVQLDRDDTDLASGGPLAIPAGYGTKRYPNLLVAGGKDGRLFLLDRDDLGGVGQGKGHTNDALDTVGPFGGEWGHPAFFGAGHGYVYVVSLGGPMYALELGSSGGVPTLKPVGETTVPTTFGFGSGSPAVTSVGTAPDSALVWTVYATGRSGAYGTLNAYGALPVNGVLPLVRSWPIGDTSQFTNIATGAGRVYVANLDGQVFGFGTLGTGSSDPIGGAPLNFGSVSVGATATGHIVLTAQRAVTVTGLQLLSPFGIGANPPSTPVTLEAGEQLTVPVKFDPSAAGGRWAYLTVSIKGGRNVSIEMTGTGTTAPALVAAPSTMAFGSQPTGTIATNHVLVTNTGTKSETITSVMRPSAASGFQVSGMPAVGSTIRPATSVTFSVTYDPARTGSASATVGIRAGTLSATVQLTGSATAGRRYLKLLTTSVNFGPVPVGQTVTRVFWIEATGQDNLAVWVTRLPTAPFGPYDPLAPGSGLYPLAPVPVTVTFHPTRTGEFSGVYTFNAHDGQGSETVQLAGSGVSP